MSGYWEPGIDPQTGDMSVDMDLATWHEREPEPCPEQYEPEDGECLACHRWPCVCTEATQ